MKKLLRNAAMLFMAASTIGLLSCSDNDDPPPSNCGTLEIDGAKSKLTTAFVTAEPETSGSLSAHYFGLLSEGLTFIALDEFKGSGHLVLFAIICEEGKSVDGTYTSARESAPTAGTYIAAGCIKFEADEEVKRDMFTIGDIKVTKIGADIYEVSGDNVVEGGNKAKFYYKGKFAPITIPGGS